MGTVLPFSAISGRSSRTRPSVAVLPPVNFLINSSESFLAANAGDVAPLHAAAKAPTPIVKTFRRFKVKTFPSPELDARQLRTLADRAPEALIACVHGLRSPQDIFIYLQVSRRARRELQAGLSGRCMRRSCDATKTSLFIRIECMYSPAPSRSVRVIQPTSSIQRNRSNEKQQSVEERSGDRSDAR